MIKMSQSVCEKLDSYCKKLSYYTTREDTVSVICHEAVHVMSTVQTKTGRIFIEWEYRKETRNSVSFSTGPY